MFFRAAVSLVKDGQMNGDIRRLWLLGTTAIPKLAMTRAQHVNRVFGIDFETCPRTGNWVGFARQHAGLTPQD